MKYKYAALAAGLFVTTALALGNVARAEEVKPSGHPGTPETEMSYKGAPVPIKPGEAETMVEPEAPPLTKEEFSRRAPITSRCSSIPVRPRACRTGAPRAS